MYYFEQTVIMLRLISLENGIQYSKTKACKALSSLWMRQLTARGRISCLCFTSTAIKWITNLTNFFLLISTFQLGPSFP